MNFEFLNRILSLGDSKEQKEEHLSNILSKNRLNISENYQNSNDKQNLLNQIKNLENVIKLMEHELFSLEKNEITRLRKEFEWKNYEQKHGKDFINVVGCLVGKKKAVAELSKIAKMLK